MRRFLVSIALSILGLAPAAAGDAAPKLPDKILGAGLDKNNYLGQPQILFRFHGEGLFDGAFGPLHQAEVEGIAALKKCGSKATLTANGRMDREAQKAFEVLSSCSQVSPKLDPTSEARHGAVTEQLWQALVGKPVPDAASRARTMMLTFEATDYTALEWNFCQSKPLYNPPNQPTCFSNDPRSFITWGPNGATAGGGREVQAILSQIAASTPGEITAAFGVESDSVNRLIRLNPTSGDTEVYLCGIWADPARREAWRAGFHALGANALVRDDYDKVYRSKTFDGGKIAAFARAYQSNGLVPSEVDFAFFKDRSAHMGISFDAITAAVAKVVTPTVDHWRVRQAIALDVLPPNQRQDRLGRDVAFYVDGLGSGKLDADEATAWVNRGSRRASDVGLSDAEPSALADPEPPIDQAVHDPVTLTPSERAACPAAVLRTQRP